MGKSNKLKKAQAALDSGSSQVSKKMRKALEKADKQRKAAKAAVIDQSVVLGEVDANTIAAVKKPAVSAEPAKEDIQVLFTAGISTADVENLSLATTKVALTTAPEEDNDKIKAIKVAQDEVALSPVASPTIGPELIENETTDEASNKQPELESPAFVETTTVAVDATASPPSETPISAVTAENAVSQVVEEVVATEEEEKEEKVELIEAPAIEEEEAAPQEESILKSAFNFLVVKVKAIAASVGKAVRRFLGWFR